MEGKVGRLPGSRSLGPVVAREIGFNAGGPKDNARVAGALSSAIRASRPGAVPASVREDVISEHQASLHAAEQLSDYLQGEKPSSAETVNVGNLDRQEVERVVVFEAGNADATIPTKFAQANSIMVTSLEELAEREEIEEGRVDGRVRGQEIFDYITARRDRYLED